MVSSAQLAQILSVDGSQIRKDLAAIGVKGHCHVGFDIHHVMNVVQQTLGFTRNRPAVVIGAGRLGGAISSYKGFANYGLHVVALFDVDPGKIGLMVGDHVVQPMEQLEPVIKQSNILLAVLTIPAEVAQESADRLIKAGIKVIWNFAPARIHVPPDVFVRNEQLFVALGQLFYNLKRLEQ